MATAATETKTRTRKTAKSQASATGTAAGPGGSSNLTGRVAQVIGAVVDVAFEGEFGEHQRASAPEMISISSLVIWAWRVRLYWIVRLLIMSPALRVALSMADIWAA